MYIKDALYIFMFMQIFVADIWCVWKEETDGINFSTYMLMMRKITVYRLS